MVPRAFLYTTLLTAFFSSACTKVPLVQPGVALVRAGGLSQVAALAGQAALRELNGTPGESLSSAQAGLPDGLFAQLDADHDASLSTTEQAALFQQVWSAMQAPLAARQAPPPLVKPDDQDGTTQSYIVKHELQFTPTQAEIFVDAGEIVPAVYQTLQSAKHSIHMDLFLLGGTTGQKIAELLAQKAREGVEVHIVHDPGFGLSGTAREQILPVMRYLQSQGVKVKPYPLRYLPHRHGNPWANEFQIDHDKFLVVDGETAMIGSMNLIDIGTMNHDVYARLTGPVAHELEMIHNATWDLRGPAMPNFGGDTPPAKTPPVPHLRAIEDVANAAGGGSLARVTKTDIDLQTTEAALIDGIKQAKKSVHIAIYEFGSLPVADALIDAYKRGVDVKVLADSNSHYGKYLPAFKVLKLHGTPNLLTMNRLRDAGVPAKWFVPQTEEQELHMKLALFDGNEALVGSTNFTYQALHTFRETSVEIQGDTVAPRLESMFAKDWETHGKPVEAPTFYERVILTAVKYMDMFNLSWW